MAEPQNSQERPLRLLSLDGGGVRGLAALGLLNQLMKDCGVEKPCKFFDMIAGTSTGGLIAIMLGRLEMTVDQCIASYLRVMRMVFGGRKRMLRLNPFGGKVLSKYDASVLKAQFLEEIRTAGFHEEASFKGPKQSECKTVVTTMARATTGIVRITDWKKASEPYNTLDGITIWQAALATTAASSFFKPFKLAWHGVNIEYLDAGLGGNNPINELLVEARDHYGPNCEERIQCLLSIGTGVPPPGFFGDSAQEMVLTIINICANTESTHQTFAQNHHPLVQRGAYHRFNLPFLRAAVELDEYKKADTIIGQVQAYAQTYEARQLFSNFRRAVGTSQPNPVDPEELPNYPEHPHPSKSFYPLSSSAQFVCFDVKSYWHHITIDSYRRYEHVYEDCAKDRHGNVYFDSFVQQLDSDTNPVSQVERLWRRLMRLPTGDINASPFRKGFILALLYMVHLEKVNPYWQPEGDNGTRGAIAHQRRELLKRWGDWVPCACGRDCGLEWNFANDIGLHKGSVSKRGCGVLEWVEASSSSRKFRRDGDACWKETRQEWRNPSRGRER